LAHQACNDPDDTGMTTMCAKPSTTDELMAPNLSSSSSSPHDTSNTTEHDYEHRSTSSKVYDDYKKRTSTVSIPTGTIRPNPHSMILHPMHKRIGLRSTTLSKGVKRVDMTLTGKQMNMCVINQLNEHLSARFRQQHSQTPSTITNEQENYDRPPEYINESTHIQSNVYDEPNELLMSIDTVHSLAMPPPPPPP
jgi:hypothetical protein